MHHPVPACREKGQKPVQSYWPERSLEVLWGKSKDACTVYKWQYLVGDSSSGLWGDSGIGVTCWWLLIRVPRGVSLNSNQHSWWLLLWSVLWLPAGDSSSGFWGQSASASAEVGIVGSLNPCNMQNLQTKSQKISRFCSFKTTTPSQRDTFKNLFFQDHHNLYYVIH